MSNLVLPPEERFVARGKPISPLAIDPPTLTEGGRPWTRLADIAPHADAIRKMAAGLGYWVHDAAFEVKHARVTDIDFDLAVITDTWIEAFLQPAWLLHARGFGMAAFLAVDVIRTVVKVGMKHPGKKALMTYWGDPFTTGPAYPDNWHKPFLNNVRKLGRAGFIALAKPLDENGRMRYLVAPSQAGFVRSVWVADRIGSKNPLDRVLEILANQPVLPELDSIPQLNDPADGMAESPAAPTRHTVVAAAISAQKRLAQASDPKPARGKPGGKKSNASTKPVTKKAKSSTKPTKLKATRS